MMLWYIKILVFVASVGTGLSLLSLRDYLRERFGGVCSQAIQFTRVGDLVEIHMLPTLQAPWSLSRTERLLAAHSEQQYGDAYVGIEPFQKLSPDGQIRTWFAVQVKLQEHMAG